MRSADDFTYRRYIVASPDSVLLELSRGMSAFRGWLPAM